MGDEQKNETLRQSVHDVRNRLNRITMQTELAKMLVEKEADAETIIAALDKSLAACEECSEQLRVLTK